MVLKRGLFSMIPIVKIVKMRFVLEGRSICSCLEIVKVKNQRKGTRVGAGDGFLNNKGLILKLGPLRKHKS